MMTWVDGNRCFNSRTHSTPFMPGRLMSMRTTSGFSCGNAFNASSAFACSPTQRNPSERFRMRAMVPRNLSLSSTMQTPIGMLISLMPDWAGQPRDRAAFARGADGEAAADIFHAFLHVAQSISAGLRLEPRQASTVVFHFQCEPFRLQLQPNPNRGSLRVLHHVVNGFLGGEKNIVAHLRRQSHLRQLR